LYSLRGDFAGGILPVGGISLFAGGGRAGAFAGGTAALAGGETDGFPGARAGSRAAAVGPGASAWLSGTKLTGEKGLFGYYRACRARARPQSNRGIW